MPEGNDTQKHYVYEKRVPRSHGGSGIAGAAYFMAFIGAAVYWIQQAPTGGAGFIAFLKAIVWPAFLIYDLLQFIGM
jgi:hypothetical protein